MLKFLHTADWQIGRIYSQFEEDDAAALFEARFKTIEKIALLANQHAVDAVLVAGDVFDLQTVSDKSIRRMFLAMQAYAGPWFLIPGNHDSALSESAWSRAKRLNVISANVHCCLEPAVHVLENKMALLTAPLCQRHTYADLTEWFVGADTPPQLPRVGLAHGSVQGILADGIDSANPIAAGRAESARLDYLALGDWHGTRKIDDRTWYSGTPESDRFKTNDSGQVLLVSIPGPGAVPGIAVIHSGAYHWVQIQCAIYAGSDVDVLQAQLDSLGDAHVVQIVVNGICDLACHQRISEAIEQVRARVRALAVDTDGMLLEPTEEDIRNLQADGYVGEVLNELRMLQGTAPSDKVRNALLILAGQLGARTDTSGEPA